MVANMVTTLMAIIMLVVGREDEMSDDYAKT